MAKKSSEEPRMIMLSGEVNEKHISDAIEELFTFDFKDNKEPIHMILSTYGGYLHEMFALYNAMHAISSPIYTIGLGKIMSAGVLLLAAGAKGHRKMGQHATLMIHPVSGASFGNIFDQENDLNETKRLQELMIDAYVEETSMAKTKILDMMSERRELFYTAEDAKKLGIVDTVIVKREEPVKKKTSSK